VISGKQVHHPLFARFYAFLTQHESAQMQTHRRELLSGLSGRVLEVGAGAGTNFNYYPLGVTEVVAVEPERYLREKARSTASHAPVTITLLEGMAERLPVDDGSCDAAVASLVLCSVPDQAVALAELRRVLRPGGELRFYEHVLSHKPRIARTQRFVDRAFWPRAFGCCHTARNTPAAIDAAGFEIEEQQRIWVAPLPIVVPVATHVLGKARRR
jgi:ubiquinone/menaquinone biosynthesis C-methylase UbiE